MPGASEVSVLTSHPEAVAALAATLVIGLALVVAGASRALPVLAVVVVVAVVAPSAPLSIGLLLLAAVVAARRPERTPAAIAQVACAAAVLAGAFVCTPDTEHAGAALGAIAGSGILTVAFRLPWGVWAHQTTVLLVWIAITDGWSRSSAVVAVLAIALVHLAAQQALRTDLSTTRASVVVVTTATAAIAIARHAGLEADLTRSLARAAALVALTLVVTVAVTAIGRATGARSPQPGA